MIDPGGTRDLPIHDFSETQIATFFQPYLAEASIELGGSRYPDTPATLPLFTTSDVAQAFMDDIINAPIEDVPMSTSSPQAMTDQELLRSLGVDYVVDVDE